MRAPGPLRPAAAAALLLAVATTTACSEEEPAEDPLSGETSEVTVTHDRVAFTIEVPMEWASEVPEALVGECDKVVHHLGGLTVEAVPASCDVRQDSGDIGNGVHGTFRTLADVPAPASVEQLDTGIGRAVVFTQEYFECTNSCEEYDDSWAIVELTEPVDPAYPTLAVRGSRDLDLDELGRLVETLAPVAPGG